MISSSTTPLKGNTTDSVRNTEYKRGDRVRVIAFGGQRLERRVWRTTSDAVFVCADHVWDMLESGGDGPEPVGFPLASVSLAS